MATNIHPSAIVESGAKLGDGVQIGPFCVVGPNVELGDGVRLVSHVVVAGRTRIGEGTTIYPFASLGHPPQDLKFKGESSELIVGARCQIRENVTMNPGTEGGGMITRIGDDCLFMAGAHVAHDCVVGDRVILAAHATLGGHVTIGDYAILGGLCAVHQFVRIGAHAMVGGMSGVENDVIPFGLVMGERARLAGLNLVGLERRGFPRESIQALRTAYRALFGGAGTFQDRLGAVEQEHGGDDLVRDVIAFIRGRASRGITLPKTENGR